MNTAQTYLKQHGISKETAELFSITTSNGYLHIPIKDEQGNDSFIKSRNLNYSQEGNEDSKYLNSQGSHATLFNFHAVKDSDIVVVTEGEVDAIKLTQEGIPAVSSTNGASTFPPPFAELLKDKEIYICYDTDTAGKKGVTGLIELLPLAKVIELPNKEGIKDICDYFTKSDDPDFFKLMENASTALEWEISHIPEEHTLLTDKELYKQKFKDMPWLVDGILYNEGFCFIYGAEGIGKSFITLSIARALATGEPWLDTFNIPHKTDVLFLDMENPLSLTQRRMKALGESTGRMHWLKNPNKFSLHNGKGGASDFALDIAKIVKAKNIGLIVVDSFVDLMVGSANSAEETQKFFRALRVIFPGIAFLVLHHENKPSAGVYRNSGQRLRGSTNINAQTFTMFRLEAVGKSKTDMTLEQTKARDEQKMDKFMLRMSIDYLANGKTAVSGFEYMGIVVGGNDENKSSGAETIIIGALNDVIDNAMGRKELLELVKGGGISERTFERTLALMEEENSIRKIKKGRAVWFGLSNPIVHNEVGEGRLV